MNVETVTRTIQLVIAPVVMVSACAILLGGLLARFSAISDRMRSMSRERLELIFPNATEAASQARWQERLTEIDVQLPLLLRRHRLAHHAVLSVYSSAAMLIVDMFVIAVAAVVSSDWSATLVLMLFLLGMFLLLLGVLYTMTEVRTSHRAVEYEVNRILSLSGSLSQESKAL